VSGAPASAVTLRALQGHPLREAHIRDMVIASARAIAERHGVLMLDLLAEDDRITVTLGGGRIVAIGFAAELRRVTNAWYSRKYREATLWGEPDHDGPDDDDPADVWKQT
jgi:hypothetical protein